MFGSQTFGSATPAFTGASVSALPSGLQLSGTGTCTRVSGATIDDSLPVGFYTIDASSCSGLSLTGANAANYTLSLVGATFNVAPAPFPVSVSGSQTFGSSTPAFSTTLMSALPSGVQLSGTVGCTQVSSGAAINASLPAGSYTVSPSSCSGLSLSGTNSSDYTLRLVGATFNVQPAKLQVSVSGSEAGSSAPTFTPTPVSPPLPSGVVLSGTVTCTRVVATITSLSADDGPSYTVDPSSCSGLSLTGPNAANYTLTLVGGTFTLQPATNPSPSPSPSPSPEGGLQ